jgi:hypothetical protein
MIVSLTVMGNTIYWIIHPHGKYMAMIFISTRDSKMGLEDKFHALLT